MSRKKNKGFQTQKKKKPQRIIDLITNQIKQITKASIIYILKDVCKYNMHYFYSLVFLKLFFFF